MEKRIRLARRYKGLTLKQMGSILGISESAVSNIERGRNKPSGSTLILLCEKLGMNQTWLETGEGEMFVSEKEGTGLQPNARFKAIREHYGLSMGAFGQEIGLSASGVSAIEYGTRNMSDKHIKLICTAFPEVSENWLRTGEGEMLLPQDDQAKTRAIAKLVQGMEYCEWRRIAHAIDRAYEMAANRAVLTQEAAEEAVMRIEGERDSKREGR